jgi:hypothetical protein
MKLNAQQLKTCVLHSIEASWLDRAIKDAWKSEWDHEIEQMIRAIAVP